MNTSALISRHPGLWHAATHHRFLEGVQDGTLPEAAFITWLAQDHRFVEALVRVQALLLARAPRADQPVLSAGLLALVSELEWFEGHLRARGVPTDQPLQPVCRAYCDFLLALSHGPYVAGITALWAAEQTYLDAWSSVLPAAPAFQEFVEHWTVPEFSAYVAGLAAAADRALATASVEDRRAVEDAFTWTARHEHAFWQMAVS